MFFAIYERSTSKRPLLSACASHDNRHAKPKARVAFYQGNLDTICRHDKNSLKDRADVGYQGIGSQEHFLHDKHSRLPGKAGEKYCENELSVAFPGRGYS